MRPTDHMMERFRLYCREAAADFRRDGSEPKAHSIGALIVATGRLSNFERDLLATIAMQSIATQVLNEENAK